MIRTLSIAAAAAIAGYWVGTRNAESDSRFSEPEVDRSHSEAVTADELGIEKSELDDGQRGFPGAYLRPEDIEFDDEDVIGE